MKTYLRHRTLNVIDVKELIALEYLDFEGKYKDYSERHDFWELCYAESGDIDVSDDKLEEAIRIVVEAGQASTSSLQRRLKPNFPTP